MANRRTPEIDIGLDILLMLRAPGQSLNQVDLADVCGCSRITIQKIEYRALNKFKKKWCEKYQCE